MSLAGAHALGNAVSAYRPIGTTAYPKGGGAPLLDQRKVVVGTTSPRRDAASSAPRPLAGRGADLEASPASRASPKGDARANAPKQYCCILIFSVKKDGTNANKIFVNVTNFKGQTIIKFSSGLIQKSGSKKQIKSNAVAK